MHAHRQFLHYYIDLGRFMFFVQKLNYLFYYYVFVCIAWKSRPRNDLTCVPPDVKPSLTHSITL